MLESSKLKSPEASLFAITASNPSGVGPDGYCHVVVTYLVLDDPAPLTVTVAVCTTGSYPDETTVSV